MARTTVHILYKVDDTVTNLRLTGYRHSAQMWPGGRAVVKIFDRHGNRVQVWHGVNVATIHATVTVRRKPR